MNRFTIRQIEPEDNARLEQVIRSCLIEIGQDHDGTIWTDPMLGNLSEEYAGEGIRYWVLENESGDISGGIGIGTIYGHDDVCELQKLYCLPELRGTGAAQALMETALSFAGQHYKKCYIETFDNTIAAQKLYERNGFVRTDKRYGATGHYACNILYLKELRFREYEFAEGKDIRELYDLQLRAFESEAEMIGSRNVPALMESYEENRDDFDNWTVLVRRDDCGKIIAAVRFREEGDHIEIGRVMVAPEWRNRGIAIGLMTAVEELTQAKAFELYTCTDSYININLYEKLGYRTYRIVQGDRDLSFAYMRKER